LVLLQANIKQGKIMGLIENCLKLLKNSKVLSGSDLRSLASILPDLLSLFNVSKKFDSIDESLTHIKRQIEDLKNSLKQNASLGRDPRPIEKPHFSGHKSSFGQTQSQPRHMDQARHMDQERKQAVSHHSHNSPHPQSRPSFRIENPGVRHDNRPGPSPSAPVKNFVTDVHGNKIPIKETMEVKKFIPSSGQKQIHASVVRRCKVWGCEKTSFEMGYCHDHHDKFVMKKSPSPAPTAVPTATAPLTSIKIETAAPPFEVKREIESKPVVNQEIKIPLKSKEAALAKALATPKILLPRSRKKVIKTKRKTA
jgi:hypothetical protein